MTTKTSPETEQRVRALRAEGKTYQQIEKEVGVSAATIHRLVGRTKRKPKGAATLDQLVAMTPPRAKAAVRKQGKGAEVERLRGIIQRLAQRYPEILTEVL